MSSPGWATVGRTAAGESFLTFSMSNNCARSVYHMRAGQSLAESSRRMPSTRLKWVAVPLEGRVPIMDQLPHSQSAVPYFEESEVQRVLQLDALLPAMEQALIDFSAGRVLQPVRSLVSIPQHRGFM